MVAAVIAVLGASLASAEPARAALIPDPCALAGVAPPPGISNYHDDASVSQPNYMAATGGYATGIGIHDNAPSIFGQAASWNRLPAGPHADLRRLR